MGKDWTCCVNCQTVFNWTNDDYYKICKKCNGDICGYFCKDTDCRCLVITDEEEQEIKLINQTQNENFKLILQNKELLKEIEKIKGTECMKCKVISKTEESESEEEEEEEEPRIYQLIECKEDDEDDDGKIYADVIEFSDKQVVVKWRGAVKSLVVFNNYDDFYNTNVKNHKRKVVN
jgi:hypothetical protein